MVSAIELTDLPKHLDQVAAPVRIYKSVVGSRRYEVTNR